MTESRSTLPPEDALLALHDKLLERACEVWRLLEDTPELNMVNYTHDQVGELNLMVGNAIILLRGIFHADCISALRIRLMDFVEPPRNLIRNYPAVNAIASAWIPQTIADQIWVMHKFATKADKDAWEASLPPELKACRDTSLIPHALPYGWHSRNAGGFIV